VLATHVRRIVVCGVVTAVTLAMAPVAAQARSPRAAEPAAPQSRVTSMGAGDLRMNGTARAFDILPDLPETCGADVLPGMQIRCATWNVDTASGQANYEATSTKDLIVSMLGLRWFSRTWRAPQDIKKLRVTGNRDFSIDWDCGNGVGSAGINRVWLATRVTIVNDRTNEIVANGGYSNTTSCGNGSAGEDISIDFGSKQVGVTVGGKAIWPSSGGQYTQNMAGGVERAGLNIKKGDLLRVRFETVILSGIGLTAWVDFNRVGFAGRPTVQVRYS